MFSFPQFKHASTYRLLRQAAKQYETFVGRRADSLDGEMVRHWWPTPHIRYGRVERLDYYSDKWLEPEEYKHHTPSDPFLFVAQTQNTKAEGYRPYRRQFEPPKVRTFLRAWALDLWLQIYTPSGDPDRKLHVSWNHLPLNKRPRLMGVPNERNLLVLEPPPNVGPSMLISGSGFQITRRGLVG